MIAWDAKERPEKEAGNKYNSDDYLGNSSNSGTMIVHATCAPSNIRYLQDVSLLNETRANVEKFLVFLHYSADGKKPQARPQGLHEIPSNN